MLSVSGLRGIVGESLTESVATRYGSALGQWFKQQSGNDTPHLVVGRDSRPSGQWIQAAVVNGLVEADCRVTVIGIASTPGVAIMTRHLGADGGIEITASHNPGQWNGIKALRHDGAAPTAEQAATIIELFHQTPEAANINAPRPTPPSIITDTTLVATHRDAVLAHIDAAPIAARKFKVVLESVHGAGGPETAALLEAFGVEVVHLFAEPTGDFPHNPEPTAANLTGLCEAVREHNADVGFAQDPDADRLAIVDEKGNYIGEEYTLALCALHVLGATHTPSTVCANLSTSRMIDDVAERCGATVIRTKVGEANVAAAMQQHQSPIGGEGNGGVIWPVCTYVRNSLAGMAIILDMLAKRGTSLSAIVNDMPRYAMIKDKVDAQPDLIDQLDPILSKAFTDAQLDTQDGVRIDYPDRWVHVRPSNTEPIMRLIAEAPTEADARALIGKVSAALGL